MVVIYSGLQQTRKVCDPVISIHLYLKIVLKWLISVTPARCSLRKCARIQPLFTKWGVDFMDCDPTSVGGNQHIIVVFDYFTKWVEAMPTIKYDRKILAFLIFNQIIGRFVILSEIDTDHGIHFQKEMMEEIAYKLGFKHGHSSPYYP
jgi:hypothetical protein